MITDWLIPFYAFTNNILTGYGIFNLIFYAEWSIPTVLTTVAIVFSWSLIQVILKLLYSWLEHFYGKWKTKKLDKIRYEVLIGLGGIFICCTVPRILVYFFADNYYIVYYTIFVSLSAINMFNVSFIKNHAGKWKTQSVPDNFFRFLLMLHLVLFIVAIRIAYHFYKEEEGSSTIIYFQYAYMLLCLASSFNMSQVLRGGIQFVEEKKIEFPAEENILKVTCPVCTQEYSLLGIVHSPRVLIECGHTICEWCADKRLKEGNKQHLFCPICNAVTVVNGPAELLPRNHAMLEIIKAVNKKYGIDKTEQMKQFFKKFFDFVVKYLLNNEL